METKRLQIDGEDTPYKTIQEAADAMQVTHPAIRSAENRNGTCKGYYWKRVNLRP